MRNFFPNACYGQQHKQNTTDNNVTSPHHSAVAREVAAASLVVLKMVIQLFLRE